MSADVVISFAQQKAFAAQVSKEEAEIKWSMRKSTNEQTTESKRRPRRRKTKTGEDVFIVTFFNGQKPKRTAVLAMDARLEAEFLAERLDKSSAQHRLRQLEGMSRSCSKALVGTKRDQKDERVKAPPFRVECSPALRSDQMRAVTAKDQAGLFEPRSGTVPLSPAEKRALRMWGLDVDAFVLRDGSVPPPWVTALGKTNHKADRKQDGHASGQGGARIRGEPASSCRNIWVPKAVSHDANVGTTRQSGGASLCEQRSKADYHNRKKKSDPLAPRPIQPAAARETREMPGRDRGLTRAEAHATKGTPDERQHPPHSVDAQRT